MQACKLRRINARSSCPEAPVSKEFSDKLMAMRAERDKQDTMWTQPEQTQSRVDATLPASAKVKNALRALLT
jgi:hypothetical protein